MRDYMGRTIDLSLIVTPGEKNNTSCDECYWAMPQIGLKNRFHMESKLDRDERRAIAVELAKLGFDGKVGPGRYQLKSADGTVYGAALVPGQEGIVDGFLVFVSRDRFTVKSEVNKILVYEGFSIDVEGVSYGQFRGGEPITWIGQDVKYGRDIYRHQIETEQYGTVPLEDHVGAEDLRDGDVGAGGDGAGRENREGDGLPCHGGSPFRVGPPYMRAYLAMKMTVRTYISEWTLAALPARALITV